jgi:hypothetical protein
MIATMKVFREQQGAVGRRRRDRRVAGGQRDVDGAGNNDRRNDELAQNQKPVIARTASFRRSSR